jgi:MazG family protein
VHLFFRDRLIRPRLIIITLREVQLLLNFVPVFQTSYANLKLLPINPMESNEPREAGAKFTRLVEIMAKLRAPGGCPWDREQTFDSIKPYTLEETYEVLDAIDARDWNGLKEELGDFMLQAVFFAQMASETNLFNIEDSLDAINEKLIRRHPHIFSDGNADTADAVKKRWDEIKAEEKASAGKPPALLLDGVSRKTPALVEAQQIASRAAGIGFDWDNVDQVFDKLKEEVAELHDAKDPAAIEDELGDMLFVIVNIARFMRVDPEQALRRTNAKFRRRFGFVETALAAQGKKLENSTVAEMEECWQQAKHREKAAE